MLAIVRVNTQFCAYPVNKEPFTWPRRSRSQTC